MNILGIDVGTTGCKVVLVNEKGNYIQSGGRISPLYSLPQLGRARPC